MLGYLGRGVKLHEFPSSRSLVACVLNTSHGYRQIKRALLIFNAHARPFSFSLTPPSENTLHFLLFRFRETNMHPSTPPPAPSSPSSPPYQPLSGDAIIEIPPEFLRWNGNLYARVPRSDRATRGKKLSSTFPTILNEEEKKPDRLLITNM